MKGGKRGILERNPSKVNLSKEDPMKKYIVKLNKEEREMLRKLIAQGQAPARKVAHARILLKADSSQAGPAWSDQAISEAVEVGTATVERVRQRFVEEGLPAALRRRKPNRLCPRTLDGEQEAYVIALACSETEEGLPASWLCSTVFC
jgi:Homeodomain-like domain